MTAVVRRTLASRFVRRDLRAAVIPWMVARFLVGGALAVARFIFNDIGHGPRPVQLGQGLFAWDASFYRDIAAHGYVSLPNGALRFFPLYPLTGRVFGWVLAGHDAAALILVANAFRARVRRVAPPARGAGDGRHRARGARRVVRRGVPGRERAGDGLRRGRSRWPWRSACSWRCAPTAGSSPRSLGLLGGLCRPLGVVLVVPAAVEALRGWRGARRRASGVRRIAAVIAPGVGLGIYLVYAAFAARRLLPAAHRAEPRSRYAAGSSTRSRASADAFGDLFGGDRFGSGLHGVWALVFIGLLVVLIRRFPASYSAYAGTVLVLTLTAHNLDSFERYTMSTFPFLLALAYVTRDEAVDRAVLVISAAALAGYAILAFLGLSVP